MSKLLPWSAWLLLSCSTPPPPPAITNPLSYHVGGTVSGLSGTLVLQDNGADDLTLNADISFVFGTAVQSGKTYSVTVRTTPAGEQCSVAGGSGTVGASDITNVVVSCAPSRFDVGGTVTGLKGSGLVLQDENAHDLAVTGNGAFSFAGVAANGDPYAVSVKTQPASPAQTCTVANGSGQISGASVSSVAVTCVGNGPSGVLDTTFGSTGVITTTPGYVWSVVVQPDGKIVALAEGASFSLIRFNPDGTLDLSFGSGGRVVGNLGGANLPSELAVALLLQPSGKLVVAGTGTTMVMSLPKETFALTRFDANGQLDTSFGTAGLASSIVSPVGRGSTLWAMAAQSGNQLVAVGTTATASNPYNFALQRYSLDGVLDTSFGTSGSVIRDFSNGSNDNNSAKSIAVQKDDKLVVGGWTQPSSNSVIMALARFNATGALDSGFGAGGQLDNATLTGDNADKVTVDLQPDGKILVSSTVGSTGGLFALARYTSAGALDTTFGSAGIVTTDLNGTDNRALTMRVQPDGKVVVGGFGYYSLDQFTVARYLAGGTLDSAFGSGGKTTVAFPASVSFSECQALAFQSDGSIVAAGGESDGAHHAVLARITP